MITDIQVLHRVFVVVPLCWVYVATAGVATTASSNDLTWRHKKRLGFVKVYNYIHATIRQNKV